jgi:hypothetical protein
MNALLDLRGVKRQIKGQIAALLMSVLQTIDGFLKKREDKYSHKAFISYKPALTLAVSRTSLELELTCFF